MFIVKKVFMVAVGLAVTGIVLAVTPLGSYVSTSWGMMRSNVKDSVPVEFEIERARSMVKNLLPDIRHNMHVIAKEEVQVARLDKQIADAQEKLATSKTEIMQLKDDLAGEQTYYVYSGRRYSPDQVKEDLANRFERYQTNEATLESLRDIHQARTRSLEAARQKLEGMLAAKRQLEVDVENLEARMKMIEVAKTTSDYNFDDSRLGQARELISDLRTRLEVAEKMVNSEGAFQGEIELDSASAADGNIVERVTSYFDESTKSEAAETVSHGIAL